MRSARSARLPRRATGRARASTVSRVQRRVATGDWACDGAGRSRGVVENPQNVGPVGRPRGTSENPQNVGPVGRDSEALGNPQNVGPDAGTTDASENPQNVDCVVCAAGAARCPGVVELARDWSAAAQAPSEARAVIRSATCDREWMDRRRWKISHMYVAPCGRYSSALDEPQLEQEQVSYRELRVPSVDRSRPVAPGRAGSRPVATGRDDACWSAVTARSRWTGAPRRISLPVQSLRESGRPVRSRTGEGAGPRRCETACPRRRPGGP